MKKPPKPRTPVRPATPQPAPRQPAVGGRQADSEGRVTAQPFAGRKTAIKASEKKFPAPKLPEKKSRPVVPVRSVGKIPPRRVADEPHTDGDSILEIDRYRDRLRTRKWLQRGSIVAGIAVLVWVLLFSPLLAFDKDQLHVTGASSDAMQQQVENIFVPLDGRSLLLLPNSSIHEQLAEIEQVARIEFTRDWPRAVSVDIIPSTAAVAVPRDGQYALIDLVGDLIEETGEVPKGVPVVQIEVEQVNEAFLDNLLQLMQNLPAQVIEQIQQIKVSPEYLVTFQLSDSRQIKWGALSEMELKLAVFQQLREEIGAAEFKVIDLMNPTHVSVE